MLTKEWVAEKFSKLTRLLPGIPSYQDRESLREQDKAVRNRLSRRLEDTALTLSEATRDLLSGGGLEHLARVDAARRKLLRLADTIRFSAHGYSGFFSERKVDEDRLGAVYDFDSKKRLIRDTINGVSRWIHKRAVERGRGGSGAGAGLRAGLRLRRKPPICSKFTSPSSFRTTITFGTTCGPDIYGHTWRDQDDGAVYEDIPFVNPTSIAQPPSGDPCPVINHNFTFYGVDYTQLYISPQGWVNFVDPGTWRLTPWCFPDANLPESHGAWLDRPLLPPLPRRAQTGYAALSFSFRHADQTDRRNS